MKIEIGLNNNPQGIGGNLGKNKAAASAVPQTISPKVKQTFGDSAGRALAEKLSSSSATYKQSIVNINSGVSLLSMADDALSEMSGILGRIQELATEGKSESTGYEKRQALDKEVQSLKEEYNRIKSTTKFNDIGLINNSSKPSVELLAGESQQSAIAAVLPTINEETAEISTPTGEFENATSQALTGSSADGIKLIDVNGDSVLDAIIGHSNKISIMLGNGDGSFSASQTYSLGFTVFNITTADVNNDGKADIIATGFDGFSDGYASVLTGAGNGTFSIASTFSTESNRSFSVTAADLNGDGFADIVTSGKTDANNGVVNVFLGNGTGAYSARTTYTMHGSVSREVKIGDVNGDGKLDIVSAGYTNTDGKVAIRLGAGDGTFGAVTQFSADTKASYALELVDLDGDNKLDIITGGTTDGNTASASVLKGNGNGTFQNAQTYNYSGLYVSSLKTADIDKDGKLDLAAGLGSGGVSVRYGTSDIAFGASTNYAGGSQTNSLDIADLNKDNALDIVSVDIRSALAGITTNLGETEKTLVSLGDISLLSTELAENAYQVATAAKNTVDAELGKIEGQLSRLKYTHADLHAQHINFNTAAERIRSFDSADDSSRILSLEIVADSSTAVFAQANQDPKVVLALLDPDYAGSDDKPASKMLRSFPDSIPRARKSIGLSE